MTDLRAKAERYASKAARCQESAQRASEGPQKVLYEVLADYYGGLATDFRQVLDRRQALNENVSIERRLTKHASDDHEFRRPMTA